MLRLKSRSLRHRIMLMAIVALLQVMGLAILAEVLYVVKVKDVVTGNATFLRSGERTILEVVIPSDDSSKLARGSVIHVSLNGDKLNADFAAQVLGLTPDGEHASVRAVVLAHDNQQIPRSLLRSRQPVGVVAWTRTRRAIAIVLHERSAKAGAGRDSHLSTP